MTGCLSVCNVGVFWAQFVCRYVSIEGADGCLVGWASLGDLVGQACHVCDSDRTFGGRVCCVTEPACPPPSESIGGYLSVCVCVVLWISFL